jgi:alpha-tubulin suppressor-like RCC1 family protein
MPFISGPDGDLKTAFVSDAFLLDQFVGNNLFTWGRNSYGQLGDNTRTNRSSPTQTITGGSNWKSVSTSLAVSGAAIKTDGTLWGWGYNNYGLLGDNMSPIHGLTKSSPVQTIAFGTNWKQVAASNTMTAAIKTDGTLWSWGGNYVGQLGDNTITNRSSPVQTIALGSNWKQVSVGYRHTAAIKTDGTLWAWGYNLNGELGDNTTTTKSSPVQTIAFGTNWKSVSCGSYSTTAAIKTDGTLWTWGSNSYGQLGDNTGIKRSSPVQTIAFGTNWKQVSCNGSTAAIKTDGTLWTWGRNSNGQLGDNTINFRSSPVQTITYGTNWKQVSCGQYSTTAAIKTDGTLWCWGYNNYGELGDNTRTRRSSPVQTVAYGTNWKQVACGQYHTAAVTNGDI